MSSKEVGGNGACADFAHETQNGSLLSEKKLSVKEAGRVMSLSVTSLRRLIHGGKIPVLKIGAKILLLERDIEQYLKGCHITLEEQRVRTPRIQALPDEVINSPHLR